MGIPRQLTLRQAVKATIMYFKANVTEELIGELLFVDQSTISRAISDLEEVITKVLDEHIPDLTEEMHGRVGRGGRVTLSVLVVGHGARAILRQAQDHRARAPVRL
jgi:Helix-turn-helix of DDE superfamily endonuclease